MQTSAGVSRVREATDAMEQANLDFCTAVYCLMKSEEWELRASRAIKEHMKAAKECRDKALNEFINALCGVPRSK
jgi:hypothetical protein